MSSRNFFVRVTLRTGEDDRRKQEKALLSNWRMVPIQDITVQSAEPKGNFIVFKAPIRCPGDINKLQGFIREFMESAPKRQCPRPEEKAIVVRLVTRDKEANWEYWEYIKAFDEAGEVDLSFAWRPYAIFLWKELEEIKEPISRAPGTLG